MMQPLHPHLDELNDLLEYYRSRGSIIAQYIDSETLRHASHEDTLSRYAVYAQRLAFDELLIEGESFQFWRERRLNRRMAPM